MKKRLLKSVISAASTVILIIIVAAAAFIIYWILQSPKSVSYNADLPILMYHDLNDGSQPCNSMTVTSQRMESDLKWLSNNGYTTVLPHELASGITLPSKPIMITFDDGYRSNYDILYPLLKNIT